MKHTAHLHGSSLVVNFLLISSISLGLLGCPDGSEVAKTCSEQISELAASVCPVGTSPILKAEASGSCSGDASASFLTESGDLSGFCQSSGSCEFVCLLQPDRCECGVQEFTATEVICKECAACGDGRCSDAETPESCPRDCAIMCTAGRLRCAGDAREECSLQGVWQRLPCPVGEQCRESGGDITCGRICVVGETRCDDGKRQQCSLQGTWETNACANGEQCITQADGSGECVGVCEMGSRRCNGDNREECNSQGQWEILACPAEERCVEDGDMVICRAGCDSGFLRCNGDTREQCSASGEWETVPCPGSERCVVEGGNALCRPTCEAGSSRCNGNAREVCSDGGEWQTLNCPDGFRCSDEGEVECTPIQSCGVPGSSRCFNGARETCTANGIWDSQPCVGESRCEDITGEAVCVECMDEWWADLDGDGTGDPENTRRACQQPDNYLQAGGERDCNDADPEIYPGKRESCDRIDNDCDINVDEDRQPACGIGEVCENAVECRTGVCDIEFNTCVNGNLVVIGGGLSTQGSALSGRVSEAPVHQVRITRPFLIQRREVTNAEWSAIFDNNPSPTPGANRPVQNVSWYDTLAYANALSMTEDVSHCYDLSGCEGTPGLDFTCINMAGGPTLIPGCKGYRLPTEAEWEFASRGRLIGGWFANRWEDEAPVAGAIFLDDALEPLGWFITNSIDRISGAQRVQNVGQKTENWNQVFDMHGNVAEWTWDVYSETAYASRLVACVGADDCQRGACSANGYCDTPSIDPVNNPPQEAMPHPRVVRGGSYDSSAFDCRHASRRSGAGPAHNVGFRLVRGMIQ